MRRYWILTIILGVLSVCAGAQTSVSGSSSTGASVSSGQSGASAHAGADAQVSGSHKNGSASAQADADANARASHQNEKKGKSGSSSASASGQSSGSLNASGAGAMLNSGTTLQAELTKSLDAHKAHAGDEVTAKVTEDVKTNGKVMVHKGSRLVGHVTEAKARTKSDAESRLGVVFDHAVLKDGSQVSLNAFVQAVAPRSELAASSAFDDSVGGVSRPSGGGGGGRSGGGGLLGGVAGTATSTVGVATNTVGSVSGAAGGTVNSTVGSAAGFGSASHGVIGLQGISLNSVSSATANGQASVLSSTTRNVSLDSGTRMILQVSGSAQR
jgi:hypothetical protein